MNEWAPFAATVVSAVAAWSLWWGVQRPDSAAAAVTPLGPRKRAGLPRRADLTTRISGKAGGSGDGWAVTLRLEGR